MSSAAVVIGALVVKHTLIGKQLAQCDDGIIHLRTHLSIQIAGIDIITYIFSVGTDIVGCF